MTILKDGTSIAKGDYENKSNLKWCHVFNCVICGNEFKRKGTQRKTCHTKCAKIHQQVLNSTAWRRYRKMSNPLSGKKVE